jgi:hypothetical protein
VGIHFPRRQCPLLPRNTVTDQVQPIGTQARTNKLRHDDVRLEAATLPMEYFVVFVGNAGVIIHSEQSEHGCREQASNGTDESRIPNGIMPVSWLFTRVSGTLAMWIQFLIRVGRTITESEFYVPLSRCKYQPQCYAV